MTDGPNKINNKEFACDECGNTFGDQGNFKRHIKTVHEKIKEFACDECGKTFGRQGELKLHIKTVH